MRRPFFFLLLTGFILFSPFAAADDLTAMVQKDLIKLGYEPGNIKGEMDTDTIVAISKFQAENDLEVTGEASPQLAGVLKARLKNPQSAAASPQVAETTETAPAVLSHEELRAAQQACLQEKYAAQQEANKKKRGMNSLLRAAARVAGRFGGNDMYQVAGDVYSANATASDISQAAEDLGLTEDDVEECRNPQ